MLKRQLKKAIAYMEYQAKNMGSLIAQETLDCLNELNLFLDKSVICGGRWVRLLVNTISVLENITGESIMGTDLEDEIGITQEEYDEIVKLRS